MKNKIDHVPERITRLVVANSQQFYEIPLNKQSNVPSTDAQDGSQPSHGTSQSVESPSLAGRSEGTRKRRASQHNQTDPDADDFAQPAKKPRYKKAGRKPPPVPRCAPNKMPLLPIPESTAQDEQQKSSLCIRCNPQAVLDAIAVMNDAQKKRICTFSWQKFLDMKVNAVESRELFLWLLEQVDVDSMVLKVEPNTSLPITKSAVATVLGIPSGTKPLPDKTSKDVRNDKKKFAEALQCDPAKITIQRLKEEIKKGRTDDLSIRCFFLTVFNRMLFPTSAFNVSNTDIAYTMDLDTFADIDWQQAIVDDVRRAVINWKHNKTKSNNPSIGSCAPFLLIYYLDNLDHPINNTNDRNIVPRSAVFTRTEIEAITIADRLDKTKWGCLQQKERPGPAYENVIPPYVRQTPTRAHPNEFELPSMTQLLQDCCDKVPADTMSQVQCLLSELDKALRANQAAIFKKHEENRHLILDCTANIKRIVAESTRTPSQHNEQSGTVRAPEDDPVAPHGPATTPQSSPVSSVQGGNTDDNCEQQPGKTTRSVRSSPSPSTATHPSRGLNPLMVRTHADGEQNTANDDSADKDGGSLQQSLAAWSPFPGSTHPSPGNVNQTVNTQPDPTGLDQNNACTPELNFPFEFSSGAVDFEESQTQLTPDVNMPPVQLVQKHAPPSDVVTSHSKASHTGDQQADAIEKPSKNTDSILMEPSPKPSQEEQHQHVLPTNSPSSNGSGRNGPSADEISFHFDFSNGAFDFADSQTQLTPEKPTSNNESIAKEPAPKPSQEERHQHVLPPISTAQTSKLKPSDGISLSNIISPGAKRGPKKPSHLISPIKLIRPRNLPDSTKALELRASLCSDGSPFLSKNLMHFGNIPYTGRNIKESFSDGVETSVTILDDCIKCLSYDDRTYRPECYGTRIFIGPSICLSLDPEHHGPKDGDREFNMDILAGNLRDYLPDIDFGKTKLVFLTMYNLNHYSIYCINFEHCRIDVLDSLNYKKLKTKFSDHHDKVWMETITQRLCGALQFISKKFPDFSRWRHNEFKKSQLSQTPEDGASMTVRFLEAFDSETLNTSEPVVTANGAHLRSEMLHYMLFHPTNRIKILPPEIEAYRQDGVPF